MSALPVVLSLALIVGGLVWMLGDVVAERLERRHAARVDAAARARAVAAAADHTERVEAWRLGLGE